MTTTFKVRFWEIQLKKNRRRKYGVRWITDNREHSEWFELKAQANGRRSELMQAARASEPFDVATGLPVSELKRRNSLSFVEFAQLYMDMKWPGAAAKTRESTVDGLATAGAAFVLDGAGRPDYADLRRVLRTYLLPPAARLGDVAAED
jgi:hypothetical protein